MNTMFELATASVAGARHRTDGAGNQDALFVARDAGRTAVVVCDGCGSAPASGVGAYVGARLVAQVLLGMPAGDASGEAFWREATNACAKRLAALVAPLGDGALHDAFLFTIVGAVIDDRRLVCFALGDGIVGCNDEVREL